jgi:phosphonate transport system substrate-binding protein
VLVTGPDSDINSLRQLADRKRAAAVGLTAADLDSLHHFDHHQTVVWQVLRGQLDAGVVKEAVAEKYYGEGLRPVARSAAIPGPPLVGNRIAPGAALDEITRLLPALDPADPRDRAVLDSWTPEFSNGFIRVDQARYHRSADRPGVAP